MIKSKIMKSKKAIAFSKDWVEIVAFILLIIGFIMASTSGSAFLTYITIFFCGMIIGRFWFQRKKDIKIPYFIIIVGFLFGYILGSYYGNKWITIILFLVGSLFSYYLHEKGFIK